VDKSENLQKRESDRSWPSEIGIIGCYGAGNFGDDLMLYCLVREIQRVRPGIRINIISLYSKDIILPNSAGVTVVRMRNAKDKLIKAIRLFRHCRFLLFGGGTCFTDDSGDGSFKFFVLARILGCRFGYLGVGIGELNRLSRRIKTSILFSLADFVVFRERNSWERSKHLTVTSSGRAKLKLAEDLAYLHFDNQKRQVRTKPEHDLLISWRDLSNYLSKSQIDELIDQFVRNVEQLTIGMSVNKITLLPLEKNRDVIIHEDLRKALQGLLPTVSIELVEESNMFRIIKIIERCRLFVSLRLHGAFMGKVLGVPTIGINYCPKMAYFFESIAARGLVQVNDFSDNAHLLEKNFKDVIESETGIIDLQTKIAAAYRNIETLRDAFEF
jgi:polysaccharide pyruvyl transferase WcaK-like protein